jgi:Tol biopolymer transport system component
MNADGSEQTPLAGNTHNWPTFVWSPDSAEIAYPAGCKEEPEFCLWKVNVSSGEIQQLTTVSAGSVAWSPDASKIAFVTSHNELYYQLWVVNSDGSGQMKLTDTQESKENPYWSVDGRQIFYTIAGRGDLWVISADGSGQPEKVQ